MANNCSLFLLEVGLAAFDENNNLLISKKFDNAISSYHSLKSGENSDELKEIIENLPLF